MVKSVFYRSESSGKAKIICRFHENGIPYYYLMEYRYFRLLWILILFKFGEFDEVCHFDTLQKATIALKIHGTGIVEIEKMFSLGEDIFSVFGRPYCKGGSCDK